MSGYLLDTNVISELTNDVPDPGVVSFLVENDDLWLASVVIHELEFGLQLLPEGQRRDRLYDTHLNILSRYDDRILPLDRAGAEWAASFRVQARRSGRTLDLGDALIAGIARANDFALATRNVRDFDGLDLLDLEVINPWEQP
jgi:predicted nucleic acid-binding protein